MKHKSREFTPVKNTTQNFLAAGIAATAILLSPALILI